MRAWSQSPRREAEGLSRLHNTITDWPDDAGERYYRQRVYQPAASCRKSNTPWKRLPMPTGQVIGAQSIFSTDSISSS